MINKKLKVPEILYHPNKEAYWDVYLPFFKRMMSVALLICGFVPFVVNYLMINHYLYILSRTHHYSMGLMKIRVSDYTEDFENFWLVLTIMIAFATFLPLFGLSLRHQETDISYQKESFLGRSWCNFKTMLLMIVYRKSNSQLIERREDRLLQKAAVLSDKNFKMPVIFVGSQSCYSFRIPLREDNVKKYLKKRGFRADTLTCESWGDVVEDTFCDVFMGFYMFGCKSDALYFKLAY